MFRADPEDPFLEIKTRIGDPYVRDVTQNVGHTGVVLGIAADPNNPDRFATASLDGSVRLWDIARGERRFKELLSGFEKGADAKSFAERVGGPSTKRRKVTQASGSGGTGGLVRGCFRVRDAQGKPVAATALAWDGESGILLVGDGNGAVHAWNPDGPLVRPAVSVRPNFE